MGTTKVVFYFVLLFCFQKSHADNVLTVSDYIKQVVSQNGAYRASAYLIKSYGLRQGEASLDFMPALIGNISYSDNKLAPQNAFSPSDTITYGGYLGVQAKLRSGTLVNLTYNSNYNNFVGPSMFYPAPYYYNNPSLTITQPLWKDFWAAFSKANEDSQVANFKSQSFSQSYNQQQISFNAETAYWRLALYKQIVEFDKQAIVRTEKILKWNERRVAMNVSDRTDLLESQASMKEKQLILQTDLELLREAASQFNSLRNVAGDQVLDSLTPVDSDVEKKLIDDLKKTAVRFDVLAAEQGVVAQKARATATMEGVKPDLSLYGNVQFSGNNTAYGPATSSAWSSSNPLYAVGLKLNVPLDFDLVGQINEGNRASQTAAEYSLARAKFELDQDWSDIQKKFKNVAVRLTMARELEDLQREKLDHERVRFTQGRTTSFQVLQFEDNYSEAQLGRLRIENDAMVLRAQAHLYNGENL